MNSYQDFLHHFIDDFTNNSQLPLTETSVLTADLKNLFQAKQIATNTQFPAPYIKVNLTMNLYRKTITEFTVDGVKKIMIELLKGITQTNLLETNSIYVKALYKKGIFKTKIAEMDLSIYLIGNELASNEDLFYTNLREGVKRLTNNFGTLETGVFTRWVDLFSELRVPLENYSPIPQFYEIPSYVKTTLNEFENILSLLYSPILEVMLFTPTDQGYETTYSYNPSDKKATLENDVCLWIYGYMDDFG